MKPHALQTRRSTPFFDITAWTKRSTKASGVPLHVQDAAVINQLQVLVSIARQSQQSQVQTSTPANDGEPVGKGE
jgi:hypothetical protein